MNSTVAPSTTENGLTLKETDMVNRRGLMAAAISGSGMRIKPMDKASSHLETGIFTLVLGRVIRPMAVAD